jgi:hypothetical protein
VILSHLQLLTEGCGLRTASSRVALIAVGLCSGLFSAPGRRIGHARQETRRFAASALSAAGILGFVFLAGMALERHPSNPTEKTAPAYPGIRPLSPDSGAELMVEGEFGFEGEGVWVPSGGTTRFWILSTRPLPALRVTLGNVPRHNLLRVRERRTEPVQVDLEPRNTQKSDIMKDPMSSVGRVQIGASICLPCIPAWGVPHDEGGATLAIWVVMLW